MKKIIPHKLVVSYAEDGTVKDSILQYRIEVDGVLSRDFNTMSVKEKVAEDLAPILVSAKDRIEAVESIKYTDMVLSTDTAAQDKADIQSGKVAADAAAITP